MKNRPKVNRSSLIDQQDSLNFEKKFIIEDSTIGTNGTKVIDNLSAAIDPHTYEFCVTKAVDIVKSDPLLTLLQFTQENLSQDNTRINDVVRTILSNIRNIIGVDLSKSMQNELYRTINRIFIDLEPRKNDQYFYISSDKDSTTYRYNIAIVAQNELTGRFFYILFVALTITTNVDEEALFSLQLHDKINYLVKIDSIKVAAQI